MEDSFKQSNELCRYSNLYIASFNWLLELTNYFHITDYKLVRADPNVNIKRKMFESFTVIFFNNKEPRVRKKYKLR